MGGRYHAGELAVQERAGVRAMAARIANGIHRTVPERAADFLREQPFVLVGAEDAERRFVWATLLSGPPGFASVPSPDRVRLDASPRAGDPLEGALCPGRRLGVLAIDPATRRRMRVNGTVLPSADGTLEIGTEEVYSNCPRFITRRAPGRMPAGAGHRATRSGSALPPDLTDLILRADTFFLASAHPERGADVSHRGGPPGFIRMTADGRLVVPDYRGNAMFNTLGNLATDPRAGLLFLDFGTGLSLHLAARGEIVWDADRIAEVEDAERLVEFTVERWVAREGAAPAGWMDALPEGRG